MAVKDTPGAKPTGSQVFGVLWKTYRVLLARAEESYRQIGLCDSDFRVLATLLAEGPMPVNAIGSEVELTTGSITTAIDRLEAKWLVIRKNHATDRRVRLVELTAKGRRLIEKGKAQHALDLDRALGTLSPADREQLLSLLDRIAQADVP